MRVEEKFKKVEREIEHYKDDDKLVEMLVDYKRLLALEERLRRCTMQDDMHLMAIMQLKEVINGEGIWNDGSKK